MKSLNPSELKDFLDEKYQKYASPAFIESDPIQIPRSFSRKQDIEIAGFLTATISWGQRPQIIKSARKLIELMGDSPYEFLLDSSTKDISRLSNFYYRTFNGVDCIEFVKALKRIYCQGLCIEQIFTQGYINSNSIIGAINHFREVFLEDLVSMRTAKHVSSPIGGSAAKRMNMYLRWMVRPASEGVDLGIWKGIPTSALMLPLDVHCGRVARDLGLLNRNQNDWKAVDEVTANLRIFDPIDPVKYDFALFGLGIFEKF